VALVVQEAPVDWEQALDQSIDQELDEAESTSEPSDEPMTQSPLCKLYLGFFLPFPGTNPSSSAKGSKAERIVPLNEPESPHEQEAPVDWEQALDQSIDQELDEAESTSEP
jgi:hypothetical protein